MSTAPAIRFRIDFAEHAHIGPGKIALLESIKEHGSVSAAARAMKLSYRRAWLLLESLNHTFSEPVSVNSVGGLGGGGVKVTPFGALVIERYRELELRINDLGAAYLADIQTHINPSPTASVKRSPINKALRPQERGDSLATATPDPKVDADQP
jgi:molybdate transport system regulatory protein